MCNINTPTMSEFSDIDNCGVGGSDKDRHAQITTNRKSTASKNINIQNIRHCRVAAQTFKVPVPAASV